MSDELKPRIRINAKATSKGEYYFDATTETDNVGASADLLINAVLTAQLKFKEAGKKIVVDTEDEKAVKTG